MTGDQPFGSVPCSAKPGAPCDFGSPEALIDRSGLVDDVAVRRCRHCGHGISWPPLSDVAFLYADRSSQDFQPATHGLAYRIKTIAFRRQARKILAQIGEPHRKIIDFGCGSGLLTRCLGDVAAPGEVTGIDFHSDSPADLVDRPYRSAQDSAELFGKADAVISMHVLEHDDDTAGLLARITRYARPGGTVMIEVPNIDCFWAPIFGRFWDAWYMPYHRVHFTRGSVRAALEQANLMIEREFAVCVPTMGRTIANLLGRPNTLPFILLSAVLQPVQWLGEAITGRPSGLRIVARMPRDNA